MIKLLLDYSALANPNSVYVNWLWIIGSLIGIGFCLSIVYVDIAKRLYEVKWLKRQRNDDDDEGKVVSWPNSSI